MGTIWVREDLRVFAQKLTLPYICSNAFGRMTLLYFLAARSGGALKTDSTLGAPSLNPVLSGLPLSKARREQFISESIMVDVNTGFADDSKEMGEKDSSPIATTTLTDYLKQAEFRRSRLKTPIKIWHSELDAAANSGDMGRSDRAVKNVVTQSTNVALAKHYKKKAFQFWFGGSVHPTTAVDYTFNQNLTMWPRSLGLLAQIDDDNVCGRVNRANLASTSPWMGRRVTTAMAPDIFELVDEANLGDTAGSGLDSGVGDGGCSLYLCTKKQFRLYARQARKEGIKVWPNGIPDMAQIGFRREVLLIGSTYVTWDPECPAGYGAALNLGTWVYASKRGENGKVTEFESMCDNGQVGGDEADQAFVITEDNLVCWAPYANTLFTNISES